MIELGTKVRDTVTGFAGIAVKRLEELHSNPQIAIERAATNGTPDVQWFAEGRIEPTPEARGPGIRVPRPDPAGNS